MKGKKIAMKFNGKCFICNKTRCLTKDYKNKGQQENHKKIIA
jgi:hypothetical protein